MMEIRHEVVVKEELICRPHIEMMLQYPGDAGVNVSGCRAATHYKCLGMPLAREKNLLVLEKV